MSSNTALNICGLPLDVLSEIVSFLVEARDFSALRCSNRTLHLAALSPTHFRIWSIRRDSQQQHQDTDSTHTSTSSSSSSFSSRSNAPPIISFPVNLLLDSIENGSRLETLDLSFVRHPNLTFHRSFLHHLLTSCPKLRVLDLSRTVTHPAELAGLSHSNLQELRLNEVWKWPLSTMLDSNDDLSNTSFPSLTELDISYNTSLLNQNNSSVLQALIAQPNEHSASSSSVIDRGLARFRSFLAGCPALKTVVAFGIDAAAISSVLKGLPCTNTEGFKLLRTWSGQSPSYEFSFLAPWASDDIHRFLQEGGKPTQLFCNQTCLLIAAVEGHVETCAQLLRQGANPNAIQRGRHGCPLGAALSAPRGADVALCNLLLHYSARPDFRFIDDWEGTTEDLLSMAIRNERWECASLILNALVERAYGPSMIRKQQLKEILDANIRGTAARRRQGTKLHLAVSACSVDLHFIQELINAGADVNARSELIQGFHSDKDSFLDHDALRSALEIHQKMASFSPRNSTSSSSPPQSMSVASLRLSSPANSPRNSITQSPARYVWNSMSRIETPLSIAAFRSNWPLCRLLLDNGADPTALVEFKLRLTETEHIPPSPSAPSATSASSMLFPIPKTKILADQPEDVQESTAKGYFSADFSTLNVSSTASGSAPNSAPGSPSNYSWSPRSIHGRIMSPTSSTTTCQWREHSSAQWNITVTASQSIDRCLLSLAKVSKQKTVSAEEKSNQQDKAPKSDTNITKPKDSGRISLPDPQATPSTTALAAVFLQLLHDQ